MTKRTEYPNSGDKLILPFAQWPRQDAKVWQSATAATDLFADEGGERAMMRAHSNRRLQSSYGRWLGFLQHKVELHGNQEPAQRIRRQTVLAYVGELRDVGNMPSTMALRLTDLVLMARLFDPVGDWSFITRLANRVAAGQGVAKRKDKRLLLRGSHELLGLGHKLMDSAASQPSSVKAATLFRDGLIIASLALMLLRRRNFVQLQLGKELIKTGQGYVVNIPATSTKTHRPLDSIWPEELVAPLQTYLQTHRPVLAERCYRWLGRAGDHLWVAATGSALTEMALYDIVTKRTKAAFGIAINPHAFRDAAATTVAVHDPVHVRITAAILGHTSFQTTEKYYNQAIGLDAHRRYFETLARLRHSPKRPNPWPSSVPSSMPATPPTSSAKRQLRIKTRCAAATSTAWVGSLRIALLTLP
jgi:integrase/recombinase XerD